MRMRSIRSWLLALTIAAVPLQSAGAASTAAAGASADGTRFTQIAAGSYYSVALRADGTVWTWGRAMLGELGVLEPRIANNLAAPARIAALSDVVAISTSGDGAQAALRADGTVWEWGAHADAPDRSVLPQPVPGLKDVAAAAAVSQGGFALTKDGALWAWTHKGQDGAPQAEQVPGTYRWTSLSSYGGTAYALDSDGAVWVFGAIRADDGGAAIAKPRKLAGLPALKSISAGGGVDRKGTAWQWNLDYASFYDAKAVTVALQGKPVKLHPELKATAVQGGLLLTESGDVWAAGKPIAGKTGKVKNLSGIRSIASSGGHALALDSKGKLWGWGADKWNEAGVIRSTPDGMLYAPVPVQPAITVSVDGRVLPSAFPAIMTDGYISVPLKDTLNALGGSLSAGSDGSLAIRYGTSTAVLRLNERSAEIDGKAVALPAAAYGLSGVTMAPAALLKQLGIGVEWNGAQAELKLSAN